jgi:hypothetical protein
MNPTYLCRVTLLGLALISGTARADAFQDCRARADRRLMATQDAPRHQTDMRHCYRARRDAAATGSVSIPELEPAEPSVPSKPAGGKAGEPVKPR